MTLDRIATSCILALCASTAFTLQASQAKSSVPHPSASPTAQARRLNTLGAGYMNKQDFDKARSLFQQAYKLDPQLVSARLNQGIALMNQLKYPEAKKILLEVVKHTPESARAWFDLGLLYKTQGEPQSALEAFQKSAALDAEDADTQYLIGQMLFDQKQYAEATAALERSLKLDPFELSAEFTLARVAQRQGDIAAARTHSARSQQLLRDKIGSPLGIGYGQQGKYSYAEQVEPLLPDPGTAIKVTFANATDAAGIKQGLPTSHPGSKSDAHISGACFFDFDGDHLPDLFLANTRSGKSALFHNLGNGRFEDVTKQSGLSTENHVIACAAGDYDNDGHTDLATSGDRGVALFHNEGKGIFRNVREAAGIVSAGPTAGLSFVDYDHDGDLDLFVTQSYRTEQSSTLLRNNGNGTFTDVSENAGIGTGDRASGMLITDIDSDRAIDVVVANLRHAPSVLNNQREGKFKVLDIWHHTQPGPAVGIAALDFDKDGRLDLVFTHPSAPGISLWRNQRDHQFTSVPLPDLGWRRAWGVAVLDYDNDGWLDIVALGESAKGPELRLFRNLGSHGFKDATSETGLDRIKLRSPGTIITGDFDDDGATDLLVTQTDGAALLLRNNGGSKNSWMKIALTGNADNRSAIGAQIQIFAEGQQQKWELPGASGYLGQSSSEIVAGLGHTSSVDVLRMLWPTGVVQDEVELSSRKLHDIREIDRRSSSCPLLFTWNGERYEFISDAMGAGIIGYWNLADPTEYLKIEGHQLQPFDGRVRMKFMEPMEEVNYLDQVRLLSIDHPADEAVFPNERFVSHPPFADASLIVAKNPRLPLEAWNEKGDNVLPKIQLRDHKYIDDFKLSGLTGFAETHSLELDLGDWDASRPLRLLMHGYTEYFTATSIYSAAKVGLDPAPPYLEYRDESGHWHRVQDGPGQPDFGFPAGLPRTIVVDLTGRLPQGATRIRITTDLQIYWDQVLIDDTPSKGDVHIHALPLAGADLQFRGYPKAIAGAHSGDIRYDYARVSKTAPYTRPRGYYTRFGDVRPLLTMQDDKFVIFGPGEEISLDFDVNGLPQLPHGWTRDYFFYVDGFTKDMDLHGTNVLTVDPLPFHAMPSYPYPPGLHYPDDADHLEYLLEYNTRFAEADNSRTYRYSYAAQPKPSVALPVTSHVK